MNSVGYEKAITWDVKKQMKKNEQKEQLRF